MPASLPRSRVGILCKFATSSLLVELKKNKQNQIWFNLGKGKLS
jgi:hypothetical protein